jgi:FixJ family two-component response regulator
LDETPLITIVDDDDTIRAAIRCLLRSHGLAARSFASAEAFLASHEVAETSCLITDIQMPGMSGIDLYQQLVSRGLHVPVIFVSAFPVDLARIGPGRAEFVGFLRKPFDGTSLIRLIDAALAGAAPACVAGAGTTGQA